jgi:hypothetical protein
LEPETLDDEFLSKLGCLTTKRVNIKDAMVYAIENPTRVKLICEAILKAILSSQDFSHILALIFLIADIAYNAQYQS